MTLLRFYDSGGEFGEDFIISTLQISKKKNPESYIERELYNWQDIM
jgi:hypothetical protein